MRNILRVVKIKDDIVEGILLVLEGKETKTCFIQYDEMKSYISKDINKVKGSVEGIVIDLDTI